MSNIDQLSQQHDSFLNQLSAVNRRKAQATKLYHNGEISMHTWAEMHSEADIVITGLKRQINRVSDEMEIDSIYK